MWLASGGCFLLGLFLTFLATMFRSALLFGFGPFLIFIGMCMGIGGLVMGFRHNRNMESGPTQAPIEGRVLARYAINGIGEMIFDNYDYDAEDARFYVKIHFLGGRREEYECARPVFDQCGEGMRGLVTIRGNWLSMFEPLPDTDETRAAYREW